MSRDLEWQPNETRVRGEVISKCYCLMKKKIMSLSSLNWKKIQSTKSKIWRAKGPIFLSGNEYSRSLHMDTATLDLQGVVWEPLHNRKLFSEVISSVMILIYDFIYLIIQSFVSWMFERDIQLGIMDAVWRNTELHFGGLGANFLLWVCLDRVQNILRRQILALNFALSLKAWEFCH